MADGSVADGTLAESQAQAAAIWRVREGITESLVRRGELDIMQVCAYGRCIMRLLGDMLLLLQPAATSASGIFLLLAAHTLHVASAWLCCCCCCCSAGAVYKYDLSMPTHKMYELVQLVRQRVAHLPGKHHDLTLGSWSAILQAMQYIGVTTDGSQSVPQFAN
jgi:hypothetical protein